MTEYRSPGDILDMTENRAAEFLSDMGADLIDFAITHQRLEQTMPPQCKHCPHLITYALEVAAGRMSLEEAEEDRRSVLNPDACGGAELGGTAYGKDENREVYIDYTCLSREIN